MVSRVSRLPIALALGVALTAGAGVLAVTADAKDAGASPVPLARQKPTLAVTSVDVAPHQISLAWRGNAPQYRVTLGDNGASVTTKQPEAVIATAQAAADARGRVTYRVEAVADDATEASVQGTLTLLPAVPAKPKVTAAAAKTAVVTWKPAAYAATYDVVVAPADAALPATALRLTKAGTSLTAAGLRPDTTYTARVRAVGDAGVSDFGAPTTFTTPPATSEFTVGSWNICSEACSGFGGRVRGQAARVQASTIDILAVQEAGGVRVGRTTRAAFSGGEREFVAAAGGAQSRYLFYRPEKFAQLAGGVWSVGHYGASWARFRDLATERTFYVVSIHLQTGKSGGANSKRGAQIRAILSRLRATNTTDDPVVLAGDFNTGRHRSGDKVGPIVRADGFTDSVEVAAQTEGARINTGSRRGDHAILSGDHVDHVYASAGLTADSWKQWVQLSGTTYTGPWLSDHNLISGTFSIARQESSDARPTGVTPVPTEVNADENPGPVN